MKLKKILFYLSLIYGLIVTLIMFFIFIPKFLGSIYSIKDITGSIVKWYDDPTGFFITYFIGYALIWWRQLLGSGIIIAGCVLFYMFNPHNMGFVEIFLIPTILVAVFYILYWIVARRKV